VVRVLLLLILLRLSVSMAMRLTPKTQRLGRMALDHVVSAREIV